MIERFEKGVIKLKNKINKKVLSISIFVIFGFFLVFGAYMINVYKTEKQKINDEYNRAMYEMVGYISSVEVELSKLQITNTTKLTSSTLATVWKQSNLAKENLNQLPTNQNDMSNASKYLTQLSDYSYMLLKKVVLGEKITDEEYTTIAKLYDSAKDLVNVMNEIYADLNDGRIKWDELEKATDEKLQQTEVVTTIANVQKIGKTFQEYEGLIYDGAFSDHLQSTKPKSLSENEVSKSQAKDNIEKIFGKENIEYIEELEDSDGRIALYNFKLKLKEYEDEKDISMTKNDGKLYLMISSREVKEDKVSMEDAEKVGLEFLKKLGIDNVKETYFLKNDNFATINYAAYQNDVVLYPDLVKVKIALDNLEVCSIECQGYIFNHTKRDNITPSKTETEAREVINKNLEIENVNLAIIPTESNSEILTYEFKGKIDERDFLIYVNANTLQEEKILLLLETEGGTLTI